MIKEETTDGKKLLRERMMGNDIRNRAGTNTEFGDKNQKWRSGKWQTQKWKGMRWKERVRQVADLGNAPSKLPALRLHNNLSSASHLIFPATHILSDSS